VPGQDRNQQATPHKRQEARKRGQIARSRDLAGALSVLSVVLLLGWQMPLAAQSWKRLLVQLVNHPGSGDVGTMNQMLAIAGTAVLHLIAAPLALVWTITVMASVAQGGVVLSAEHLAPSWQRLNPLTNLGQMLSSAALSRTLKSMVPVEIGRAHV
jgi:flagellar biosynthetic protein FlhB